MLRNVAFGVLASVVAALFGGAAVAQELTPEQQKAVEIYQKAGALNENHAFLKNYVGDWDVTTSAWMQAGAAPAVSNGWGTGELVLGGRFVMIRFTGVMFGQPFEGIEIVGFDNIQQKFTSFWVDNTATSFYLLAGTRKPGTNTIEDSGMWPDPSTGGLAKVHAVTTFVSPGEWTYQLFMIGADGKEFKAMENRCVRKE